MECHDLRMDQVAAVKRVGNCGKSVDFAIDFDGEAIALAEIAIEISDWTGLPLTNVP